MENHPDIAVLEHCLIQLSELAELHRVSLGHAKNIERHLRSVVQIRERFRPPSPSVGRKTAKWEGGDRWADDIVAAYERLGGNASHQNLYNEVQRIRLVAGRSLPPHFKSLIRQTLQAHCSDARQYKGGADLFVCLRAGRWGLRVGDLEHLQADSRHE